MITPAEAKLKIQEKIAKDKAREEKSWQSAQLFCKDFFKTNVDFRQYAEDEIEKGIERAIDDGCKPLYVLSCLGILSRKTVLSNVKLSWINKAGKVHNVENVNAVCINASRTGFDDGHIAKALCEELNAHLNTLGWKTQLCELPLDQDIQLDVSHDGSSKNVVSYMVDPSCYIMGSAFAYIGSAFRLCYEG